MYTTRYSLIERVGQKDEVAWQEFYDLYGPLIFRYGRQRGLRRQDAEEIVSTCFEKLIRAMPGFEYRPERGRFKSWLKRLVNNAITDARTSGKATSELTDDVADEADELDTLWDQAWRAEVLQHAIRRAADCVSSRDYQVFSLNVLEGWSADRISEVFGLTTDHVYRIKYRVLQIVREQAADRLADESP